MKYILLLPLIPLILFSSCTLTQRRYTSGYSVNWSHKAPKIIVQKEPASIAIPLPLEPIPTKAINSVAAPAINWTSPARLKQVHLVHDKNIAINYVAANSTEQIINASGLKPVDKDHPQFFTGDEQEDDHARKSLVHGFLALGIPAAAFLIMFGIMLSIGGTLAFPVAYAVVIFAIGCVIGLYFAVSAIINGFIAIKEINAEPDTYNGKGEAITGIILAALLPISLAAFLLIRYLYF